MSEYITRAIVLGFEGKKEHDKVFDLYTESFGRIRVQSPGGRKILSKLSPHLDTADFATVKIIEKNNLTLADSFREEKITEKNGNAVFFARMLRVLSLVKRLSPEGLPDGGLWHFLGDARRRGEIDFRALLGHLGYGVENASCEECGSRRVAAFSEASQEFFCDACCLKLPGNNVLYL